LSFNDDVGAGKSLLVAPGSKGTTLHRLNQMPLILRRARDGRASAGTPDDYDVLDGERVIGRIFRSSTAPQDRPWMWTITGAVVAPRLPSHGLTLDDAKAPCATTWREWLRRTGG
jgi:hypothetical protein